MKNTPLLVLLTALALALPAFCQTPEEITAKFKADATEACRKIDATLRREGTAIAAKLIEKGDTAGAAEVAEQIETKASGGAVSARDPAAATLFNRYDLARQAALKPLQAASLQRLDALLKTSAAKDIATVLEIGKAREAIESGRLNPLVTSLDSSPALATSDAEGQVVEIDATSDTGALIGTFKAGQRLRVSYIDGTWTAYVLWPADSPDETPRIQHRLSLVRVTPKGSEPIEVPLDTKKRPFLHKITEDGDYALRIADNAVDSNAGKVRYRVSVTAAK